MKILVLWMSIFASLQVAAHSSDQDLNCSTDVYKGRFYDKVPRFGDISLTLDRLERGHKDEIRCFESFMQTPEGKSLVVEGRLARLAYLTSLGRDYPEKSDLNLVLYSAHEVRRRLFGLIERGKKKPGETKPKIWEVRARALTETTQRFGLPAQMTDGELEQKGRSDPKYYPALDYFRRREHRLMEQMTSTGPVLDRSPEKFKAQMIERLTHLRLKNFLSALGSSPDLAKEKISLREKKNGQLTHLTVDSLNGMNFGFLSNSQTAPSHVLAQVSEKQTSTLTSTGFFGAFLDRAGRDVYGFEPSRTPSFQNLTFVLTGSDGKTLTISETDFNKLLFSLLPRLLSDYFTDQAATHRYRLEALARDLQLAEVAQFLRGKKDKTVEDLYRRLSDWIKAESEIEKKQGPFLTDMIARRGPKGSDDSALTNFLWSGWGKHPAYWKIRAQTTYQLKLPESDQYDSYSDEALIEWTRKKRRSREEERPAYRYSSEKNRRKTMNKKLATWAAAAFGGFMFYQGLTMPEMPNLPEIKLPEMPRSENPLPQIQLPFDFDLSFLKFLFGNSQDRMDFNDFPRFDNYRIDPPKDGTRGGRKTESSAHDPTDSPYAIEILRIEPGAPVPRNYNFATVAHLPKVMQSYKGDLLDGMLTRPISMHGTKPEQVDLVVDVNLRSYSLEKRLGILQMAHYRLMHLELYDGWGKKVPSYSFKVFEIPGNRQTYAKLDSNVSAGPYSYRASYKIDLRYAQDAFNPVIKSTTLTHLNGRLLKSGFTALSTSITAQTMGQDVSFSQLSDIFVGSASYTFTNQKWSIQNDADPAFKPFTKFLNNGNLYYQCTGSNIFFQTALTEAVKFQPDLAGVQVQHLVGYMGTSTDGVLKGTPGHLHTVAHRIKWESEQYIELDATPSGISPWANRPQPSPRPNPTQEDDQPWRAILPQRPKLDVPNELEEEKSEQIIEAETAPAPQVVPASKALHHAEIERILRMLTELRKEAVESLKPVYESEPWLARQNFLNLPGLRLIVLSQYLLDGFHNKSALSRLEARFAGKSSAESETWLNHYFKTELEGLNKSLPRLDDLTDTDKYAAYTFLVQDPLRSRLRELAQFLGAYEWGSLLRDYNDFHSQNPCEKALSN